MIDVVQQLSPRSSLTIAGGYDFTNFLDKSHQPCHLVNSQQFNGQIGFNHLLNKKDQIGFLYAFQDFHFPTRGKRDDYRLISGMCFMGTASTGRLNFTAGGGPQLLVIHSPIFGKTSVVSGNGSVAFALYLLVSHQCADSLSALRQPRARVFMPVRIPTLPGSL